MKETSVLIFFLLMTTIRSSAAPHPGMGSSVLSRPEFSAVYAQYQFRFQPGQSWSWQNDPKVHRKDSFQFQFLSDSRLQLHLQVQNLEKNVSFDHYVKQWMKDYPSFGFDIQGAKPFTENDSKGLVVDLRYPSQKKTLRQSIFKNSRFAVTMTCSAPDELSGKMIQECNQVIKTFRWLNK
jgi:hypothetical protein